MSETLDAVPDWLVGAWHRESLLVNGKPELSKSRVVWLQAAPHFADVRMPPEAGLPSDGETAAFAGRGSWSAPRLTFLRELDLDDSEIDDVGVLAIEGDRLIERGEFSLNGQPIPYEESWLRQDLRGREYLALAAVDSDRRLVVVGGHAILMTDPRPALDFSADYWRQCPDGSWSWQWGTGSNPGALPEIELVATGEVVGLPALPRDCPEAKWRVQDRGTLF